MLSEDSVRVIRSDFTPGFRRRRRSPDNAVIGKVDFQVTGNTTNWELAKKPR